MYLMTDRHSDDTAAVMTAAEHEEANMANAQRKPQAGERESLMDYVAAHDGRLPEPLRSAVNASCREAFFRLREQLLAK